MSMRKQDPSPSFPQRVWSKLHLVDWCLLMMMAVLLVQSAYTLFFPVEGSSFSDSIDIVIRTSAAGIFGYFLSANFAARDLQTRSASISTPASVPEWTQTSSADSGAPKNQIGFAADSPAPQVGASQPVNGVPGPAQPGCCRAQVVVAAGIGLFCLITLILMRNLGVRTASPDASDSLIATASQFRDFVSGCVGFLIGSPTSSKND